MSTEEHPRYAAPGPGGWRRDDSHMPDPLCRYMIPSFLPATLRGMAQGFRRYGVLLERFDVGIVRGRGYLRPRPVGAPDKPGPPPPRWLFKLLFLLHPELRRRRKRAAEVWATRAWREHLTEWRDGHGPRLRRLCLELQAEDLDTLDAAALRAHIARCHAVFEDGCVIHFESNPAHAVPVGDWARRAVEWTGATAAECMKVLSGSSPASSETAGLLDRIVEHVERTPAALDAVRDEHADAAERVVRLRASSRDVAVALDAYLELHGWRVATGFDLVDQCLIELPGLLLGSIAARMRERQKHAGGSNGIGATCAAAAVKLRARVPEAHRTEYDVLLEEARTMYGLRDENVGVTFVWPQGLLRRALLNAGARLAKKQTLSERDHVFELEPAELRVLLGESGSAPDATEVAERVAERARLTLEDAPLELGEPEPPPPDAYFPPECLRMTSAIMFFVRHFDSDGEAPQRADATTLGGHGVSSGRYEGTARVVRGPADFGKLAQGDVLVAKLTSPAYNVVLPLLGAVVTDKGGALCHTAIVAREYGIPGVVGTGDATARIPDGARVMVDGDRGIVEIRP